ncbi:PLP-dependent aminotransferase family protein [Marinomonas algicola]|uniref:aminotransferase-like domain-containing protein n=1 Tax=Marinomonas algicola TaxID=2773454 RepID=UPI00174CA7BA|nr:PLP-dependent aminotransferase family protein [Marinomonas algicola]
MEQPLYEKIANQIEQQILNGVFLPGTKITSVRKCSNQLNVSVATILQAYSLLEDRGVIKAKPQKGYYVQDILPNTKQTEIIAPAKVTDSVPILINKLLHASQDDAIIQFGAAIPEGQFLPIRQLQRSVGRLMRLEPEICAAYEFTPGALSLRRQIAIRMLDSGCKVQPSDITITLGCQNAIMHALKAVTSSGDTVVVETPTYHGILQAIEVLHLKAIEVPCLPDSGIDLDHLEKALNRWDIKACLVTPNNQNPTGSSLTKESREKLLKICNQHNTTIIEDDVYGELSYENKRENSLMSYKEYSNVIYCSSFSKSIAPGFRVGWIIGGLQQEKIEYYASAQSLATPTLTQRALANFLENGAYDRHLRKTRQAYEENMHRCRSLIAQYFPEGTTISKPSGGFLLWISLPKNIDALTLHKSALLEGIGTIPGLVFSITPKFTHHLRINYAISWNNKTDTAIKRVGELCQEQ